MSSRSNERTIISREWFENRVEKKLYFVLQNNEAVKGRITDINLNGIGFEVNNLESEVLVEFKKSEGFFIKLYYGSEFLVAGVSPMWGNQETDENKKVYKGGFRIDVISPEEKLKLFDVIEKIRGAK